MLNPKGAENDAVDRAARVDMAAETSVMSGRYVRRVGSNAR
jgi:hypothetical protein